jgi:tyrosinase
MANGFSLRKNIELFSAAELAALRDAYAQMMALRASDNRGWFYWAGLHGYPNGYCWHHGRIFNGSTARTFQLFLPWHRAFLISFEHAVRDRNGAATLPWWDWTTHAMPAAFTDPTDPAGQPNPLLVAPVPGMPNREAGPVRRYPSPENLPSQADVDAVLGLSSFGDFTAQLEDLHDQVHGVTGGQSPDGQLAGDMGMIPAAAYDPIFWSHHCTIDRLFYLWQLRYGVTNIPPDYLDLPLQPFNLRVRDVLDVHALGYDYAAAEASVDASGGDEGGDPAAAAPAGT